MILLNAVSIDEVLYKRILSDKISGKVHSLFNRAMNIEFEVFGQREMTSIVASEKFNGPNYILLDLTENFSFFSAGINTQMKTEIKGNEILVGDEVFISLRAAVLWEPKSLRRRINPAEKISGNLKEIERTIPDKTMHTELLPTIKEKNQCKLKKVLSKIIGLGEGLTPSGDDFLVGFIALLQMITKYEILPPTRRRVQNDTLSQFVWFLHHFRKFIPELKNNTNFISTKFLEYASQGRFSEVLLDFVDSILFFDREEVNKSSEKLLSFGASSGRDIMRGVHSGLNYLYNKKIKTAKP